MDAAMKYIDFTMGRACLDEAAAAVSSKPSNRVNQQISL